MKRTLNTCTKCDLFWWKHTGHHPSFATSPEKASEKPGCKHEEERQTSHLRADVMMPGACMTYSSCVQPWEMTQQPSSTTPVWNWTLSAHILNILSPPYYKTFQKMDHLHLKQPHFLAYCNFFCFYSFLISKLLWVILVLEKKDRRTNSKRAVPE